MAKQVVALEASFDTSQAEGSVKSLKAQLKEAQADVQKIADKFGETSTQAADAAKKAAALKDRIGDAKALTDAFNPDKKFQAFSSALSGVAGGFAAVQGAQALFGSESKELEKTLVKVQAAMALSQGLSAVTESIDAFKNLGTVLKNLSVVQKISAVAQRVWNAAMEANPIGAIILAITLLIAAATALFKYFSNSSKAAKENEKAVKENAKSVENLSKQLDKNADALQKNNNHKLAMAKASGATTKAIRELELKLIDEKIAMAASSREAAKNEYAKQKLALANLKAADADDELIKKQVENLKESVKVYNEQNENVKKAGEEKVSLINKQAEEIKQEETNANTKSAEDRKAENAKRKQAADEIAKKVKEDTIANNEQLRAVKQELELAAITDEDERAKKKLQLDFDNEKLKIQNSKGSAESKNALILELEKKLALDKQAIDDEANKKSLAEQKRSEELIQEARLAAIQDGYTKQQQEIANNEQKAIDDELDKLSNGLITQEQYNINRNAIDALYGQQRADATKANGEKVSAEEKKAADDKIRIAKEEAEQKKAIQDAAFGALDAGVNFLKGIAGKNKGLQKASIIAEGAIGIAKMITANQTANIAALATPQAILTSGVSAQPVIAFNNIKTALSIATTVAATAKALSAIGAGGGGGGVPGGGGAGGAAAPIQPQASATTLNQMAINNAGNQAIKTYVVESDVSGNQERIDRIQRAARIGP